jgi:succinate dehydrogenase / fumarate reductase membrane anchor subunit
MRDRTLWTWHIFAGAVILVFLGLHMTIMHLNGTFPTFNNHFGGEAESWANVAWRMKSVFFAVTYVVMLGAALYHGLYGLRNILLELNPGAGLRKSIDVALSVLGLALFAFGAWVAVAAPGVASRMGG